MAEAQKSGEQSMDDILASIRRIISDDPDSTVPAAVSDAGKTSDNAGGQNDPGVGAIPGEGGIAAQTVNPSQTDDLSDIFEPSAVPRAGASGSGMPMTGGSEVRGGAIQETASWAFDAGGEATGLGGSLKSKLASLDGTSQTAVSLEPGMPKNGGISSSVPDAVPNSDTLIDKQNVDGPIDGGVTAVRPDVTGDGRVETPEVIAEPVRDDSKPLAGGAAPVPTAQAAVEQPAAEPQRASEPAMPAKTMTAEALISDIRKQEMRASPVAGETNAESATDPEASTKLPASAMDAVAGSPAPAVVADKPTPVVAADGGKTLEAMVAEALQPILREWLDANLPRLVEEKLQAEIERLARDGKLKSG